MTWKSVLVPILADEQITRGLGDAEARVLVEWFVDQTEMDEQADSVAPEFHANVDRLVRRSRAIARFVELWCYRQLPGAATQLAASEGFTWPLPIPEIDPYELMTFIVAWEREPLTDDEDEEFQLYAA